MRWSALAIVFATATAATAAAEPPPLRAGEDLFRPPIEWSTWIRVADGVARTSADVDARGVTEAPESRAVSAWQAALGAEASLPLSVGGNVRLGAWAEQRGFAAHDAFAGGELVLTAVPRHWEQFVYDGSGVLALRAGRSDTAETAALSFGWLAPWWLEGPCEMRFFDIYTGVCAPRAPRTARYMVGVRGVVTVTRALDDPRTWSATLGVEFEPAGALRMFTVRRSWY